MTSSTFEFENQHQNSTTTLSILSNSNNTTNETINTNRNIKQLHKLTSASITKNELATLFLKGIMTMNKEN